jgi:hypothetical protein
MKQRITFTRTETIVFELDYSVDPHTRANAEFWANQGYCGVSPIGRLGTPAAVVQTTTDWRATLSTPPLSPCATDMAPKSTSRRH